MKQPLCIHFYPKKVFVSQYTGARFFKVRNQAELGIRPKIGGRAKVCIWRVICIRT